MGMQPNSDIWRCDAADYDSFGRHGTAQGGEGWKWIDA